MSAQQAQHEHSAGVSSSVPRELRRDLSHVLWIGGATDAGKTTIAEIIAERCGLQLYHYDRHDLRHVERLAETRPRYRAFLDASLDERWVHPEPEDLLAFLLRGFQDRFPLVIEDLLEAPREPAILAEGFGFMPDLLWPVLSSRRQAAWLVPTEDFKRASMERRNKPSFKNQVSDPERATANVFVRDMMLTEEIMAQAASRALTVHEVDGTRSVEEMARMIRQHLALPVRGTTKGVRSA